jgi:homoserine dehydrogenase
VQDKAGVLAKISSIFAKYGISIVEISQKQKNDPSEERVPLLIITHQTTENSVKNAVAKVNASNIGTVEAVIHVES